MYTFATSNILYCTTFGSSKTRLCRILLTKNGQLLRSPSVILLDTQYIPVYSAQPNEACSTGPSPVKAPGASSPNCHSTSARSMAHCWYTDGNPSSSSLLPRHECPIQICPAANISQAFLSSILTGLLPQPEHLQSLRIFSILSRSPPARHRHITSDLISALLNIAESQWQSPEGCFMNTCTALVERAARWPAPGIGHQRASVQYFSSLSPGGGGRRCSRGREVCRRSNAGRCRGSRSS